MARGIDLVLVRHGETVGESSIRYYGITDVVLSSKGRAQATAAKRALVGESFECLVASPLCRAWQTATVLYPRQAIELEEDFREVDFGAWEGLTGEEIAARDGALHAEWQRGRPDFVYPGGETREDFRVRVERGLERLLARKAKSALVVAHKGVIRILVAVLSGEQLPSAEPALGAVLRLSPVPGGSWRLLGG
jgi:broad specificity phosphatase PhoE